MIKLIILMMTSFSYFIQVQTEIWRSNVMISKEMKKKEAKEVYFLFSKPMSELPKYVSNTIKKEVLVVRNNQRILSENEINLSSFRAQFEMKN